MPVVTRSAFNINKKAKRLVDYGFYETKVYLIVGLIRSNEKNKNRRMKNIKEIIKNRFI